MYLTRMISSQSDAEIFLSLSLTEVIYAQKNAQSMQNSIFDSALFLLEYCERHQIPLSKDINVKVASSLWQAIKAEYFYQLAMEIPSSDNSLFKRHKNDLLLKAKQLGSPRL